MIFLQGLLFLFVPTATLALAAGGIGVVPHVTEERPDRGGWFLYEVDPGEVIQDEALLINNNDQTTHLTLDPLDAALTADGAFSLIRGPEDNKDIGTWIKIEQTEFDLEPHTQLTVPFTIEVPQTAEVGDHIGGLAVYESEKEPETVLKSGGAKVGISTRVGARIYLTVAGDIVRDWSIYHKLFYGQADKIKFRFTIANRGNIRANLFIKEGRIYNIFGLFDKQEDISLAQVFPRETVSKTFTWPGKGRPLFGPYLAIFTIEDKYVQVNPNSHVIVPEVEPKTIWMITFFIPFTQTAVLLGLLFIAWFLYRFITWKRLSNLARRPVKKYSVKAGDTLVDIAEDFGVSWKLVAHLNELKPPYSLRQVKVLYVPDASGERRSIPITGFWTFITKPVAKMFRKRTQPKLQVASDAVTEEYIIVIDKSDKRNDIETFTGLKWQTIAKYNHLKSTFKLRVGTELKIPGKKPKKK